MSIWKDLLLHGGYVATPLALRLVMPELVDPSPAPDAAPPPSPAPQPAPVPGQEPEPVRPPWSRLTMDHQLLR
jgi:hypothetical protein